MNEQLKQLVKRFKDGDQYAFTEFYSLTVRFIYSTVYTYFLSKEETEDVIQNTYFKLYMIRKRINAEQSPVAYLRKIAVNYALKQMRKRKMIAPKKVFPTGDSNINEMVHEALEKLNEKDRLVISLHYLSNTPIKEISMLTGEKESTVKTRLFRAKNKLKEALKDELF